MKCCKVMSPPAHLISIYRYFQSRRGRKIGADMSHKFPKHIMVAMCKAYPALYLAENEYGEWNLILMCPTKYTQKNYKKEKKQTASLEER